METDQEREKRQERIDGGNSNPADNGTEGCRSGYEDGNGPKVLGSNREPSDDITGSHANGDPKRDQD